MQGQGEPPMPSADQDRTDSLPVLTDVPADPDVADDAVPLGEDWRPPAVRTDRLPVLTDEAGASAAPDAAAARGDWRAERERLEGVVVRLAEELALARARIAAFEADAQPTGERASIGESGWELVRLDLREESTYALARRARIGRAPACEIWIDSPSVSRHHALLMVDDQGAIIEDLQSTNGVYLNGRRIARQRLHDGDVLTIGETKFRVSKPPEAAR